MNPTDTAAAIARLMMLAAGPLDTKPQVEAVGAALEVFDDVDSLRRLAVTLAVRTAEKIPGDSAVALTSLADLAALAILAEADTPPLVQRMVDRLPTGYLPDVATSLLAMWRHACSAAAIHALEHVTLPDHVPTEGA